MPRVFVSYARVDGEVRAGELRDRLTRNASDIVVQQDRIILEGGVGWWNQITEAIDSVEFLNLVMTPAATTSGNVEKEWRYARQQGVCVYPVKGAPDSEIQFPRMPRWMSKAHFYDLEKGVAHLHRPSQKRTTGGGSAQWGIGNLADCQSGWVPMLHAHEGFQRVPREGDTRRRKPGC